MVHLHGTDLVQGGRELPREEDEELEGQSVQLPRKQWRWLDERVRRHFSRSRGAEIRRLIADAMEAEQRQETALV